LIRKEISTIVNTFTKNKLADNIIVINFSVKFQHFRLSTVSEKCYTKCRLTPKLI